MAEESIKCLINAVTEALESRGTIRTLRAQLLTELFKVLEEKPYNNIMDKIPSPPIEVKIINELIKEYLIFNNYNYTLSVFTAENGSIYSSSINRQELTHYIHIHPSLYNANAAANAAAAAAAHPHDPAATNTGKKTPIPLLFFLAFANQGAPSTAAANNSK